MALGPRADINAREFDNGQTPMFSAAGSNAVKAMRWLRDKGADINARDKYGNTPMHDAASANAVGAMEWLKAQGADVNAQTFYSDTPLHLAAKNGAVAAMNWLKVNGGLDDDFMFSYFTWLSPRDTYNSRGAPLNDVCAIVQQDRANVHKFGNPDSSDIASLHDDWILVSTLHDSLDLAAKFRPDSTKNPFKPSKRV